MAFIFFLLIAAGIGCKKDKSVSIDKKINPNDFLSANNYDQLVVEIQYVTGFEPTAGTVANLKAFLEQRLNKPAGITFVMNAVASSGKTTFSADDIRSIEGAHRTQQTSGKTLTAYFYFADGDYASNSGSSKVLGVAYGNTSMVIFEKTIREFSGGIGKPSATVLESTVIEHEFGHILGLVNNGTGMQSAHQDEPNGKHCSDKDCLMYYAVETSSFIGNLMGGVIPSLNSQCIDDLRANGGK